MAPKNCSEQSEIRLTQSFQVVAVASLVAQNWVVALEVRWAANC